MSKLGLLLIMLICFIGGLFVMEIRHASKQDVKINTERIIALREELLKNDIEQMKQIEEIKARDDATLEAVGIISIQVQGVQETLDKHSK